jgi:hypothetical protein
MQKAGFPGLVMRLPDVRNPVGPTLDSPDLRLMPDE